MNENLNVEGGTPEERIDREIDRDLVEIEKDARDIERLEEEKRHLHVTIIVDGTPHKWPRGKITFAEVVTLEFPDYKPGDGINYSVKYTKGPKENRSEEHTSELQS